MAVFEDRILRLPADVVAAVWMGTGFGALAVSRQADTKLYRLTLIDGTESFTLWEGEAGVSPMLFHIEGETALCFFPGEALLSISRPEATVTCTKLSPDGKLRMPVMLGVGRDGLPALINQPHGIDIVRLYVSKARYGFGPSISGPDLAPGSRVSALGETGAGDIVLLADNAKSGVEVWRHRGRDGWQQVVRQGYWRHGFNGAVSAITAGVPDMVAALYPGEPALDALGRMPVAPELLILPGDGDPALIIGETRASPDGLIVPLSGPSAATGQIKGRFSALAAHKGAVYAALQESDTTAHVFRIGQSFRVELLEHIEGRVLHIGSGANPWDEVMILVQ